MPYVDCRDAREFISSMRSLLEREGPCVLDEIPRERKLGFRRGDLVVRLKLSIYHDHSYSIDREFGRLVSSATYRWSVARMIEHGHLPSGVRRCAECVAQDPELTAELAADVLES